MAARAAAATLLLTTLLSVERCACEWSSAALSTHVDTLLAQYDREAPPAPRATLRLALDVRHAALDDAGASMHLLADLTTSWVDPRVVWNATQWAGDSVLVAAARLWTPDVQLVSGGGARDADSWLRARVSSDGAVALVRRLDLAVPVALRLDDWPRDTQQADFKFASRAHSLDELDLIVNEQKGSVVVESGAWEVLSVSGSAVSWQRADGSEVRAAAWRVRAARRSAALSAQHGAVLAAATLLLGAAALRPYTQRLPLAACATLVTALWLISVISVVPGASSSPRVVRVMCALCVLGACSGAGAALAQSVARRAAPPPAALRALLSRLSALHSVTPEPEWGGGEARSGAWAAAAHLLDAALAGLLALALLILLAFYWFH